MSTPKTHPVNVSHLVVGLVFLGIAGSWALRAKGLVSNDAVGWLLPLILVGAGAVGLVGFAAKGASRRRSHEYDDLADVRDLEAAAYAPYEADVLDTLVPLDQQEQHHPQSAQSQTDPHDQASGTRNLDTEGDHR